jgi:hypothetical protein
MERLAEPDHVREQDCPGWRLLSRRSVWLPAGDGSGRQDAAAAMGVDVCAARAVCGDHAAAAGSLALP